MGVVFDSYFWCYGGNNYLWKIWLPQCNYFSLFKLIVLTCLLSIYLLNQFDQIYIRLTLALLSISEILDVLWLFMYASQTWNPPTVGNNSSGQVGYLRFIVFFTICIVLLKVPLGYFLFKYRNASPDTKYPVSVLGGVLKIVLSANKSNPITRGINNSIEPWAHITLNFHFIDLIKFFLLIFLGWYFL